MTSHSPPTCTWLRQSKEGILIHFYVQPSASSTQIVGLHGDPARLKIRLAAPPVEGKANEELLRFLKKTFKLPLSNFRIVRGESSRSKDVLCIGVSINEVQSIFGQTS